jgi:hypothetical protein
MGVTHRRRVVLVSLLVGLVVTLDLTPEIAGAPRAARGVVLLGTIEVAGTVWHLRLDDAGRRLALSTVRYPENELQRNELSLYTLPASGTLAERPVSRSPATSTMRKPWRSLPTVSGWPSRAGATCASTAGGRPGPSDASSVSDDGESWARWL